MSEKVESKQRIDAPMALALGAGIGVGMVTGDSIDSQWLGALAAAVAGGASAYIFQLVLRKFFSGSKKNSGGDSHRDK